MAKTFYTQAHKTIFNLYALLAAGAVLMIIPYALLPYAGMACLLVGSVAAYIYRWKNKGDEFMRFHTTYAIRTMWWSLLVLVIGIFFFGCILFFNGDMTPIHQLMADAEKGMIANEADIRSMQYNFVSNNMTLILIAATFTLLPYPLYIIARCFKGAKMVKKKAEA